MPHPPDSHPMSGIISVLIMSMFEKRVGDKIFPPIPQLGSGKPCTRISTQLAHASDYIWKI